MVQFFKTQNANRVMRLKEVCYVVGLSRSSIYRKMRASPPTFPPRIKLSDSAVGWREEAIALWLEERQIESGLIQTIQ